MISASTSLVPRRIGLLDTSVSSTNVGDEIIMESVRSQLSSCLADAYIYHAASHDRLSSKSRRIFHASDMVIAGGTNLLSSHAAIRSVWKLSVRDWSLSDQIVTMGVGWYHDQGNPDYYTKLFYRRLFSQRWLHSVRDDYTRQKLATIGIENVVNTGCPTLWGLGEYSSPMRKAGSVVTTINTYMRDLPSDRALVRMLFKHYEQVFAWVQSADDYEYLRAVDSRVNLVSPNLRAYDDLLESSVDLDYVGNRLHAGIRAMQKGRRALIVEIDNRAREMGGDFGLQTYARNDMELLARAVEQPERSNLQLPIANIQRWRNQFVL